MANPEHVQISDISTLADGTNVTISGMVIHKYKTAKETLVATLKDFSGTIKVSVRLSEVFTQSLFWKQTIMQVSGYVRATENGERRIENLTNVLVFSKNDNNNICLSELDAEIRQKASLILMSNICRSVSNFLLQHSFVEFDSRVISYNWQMDGLETLNVLYPGFGSPATLVTSPSPQIVDFLKTTMVSRAFTESISFATTFRFKDGAAETKVLMAKALDLSKDDLYKTLYTIAHNVLKEFGENDFVFPTLDTAIKRRKWSDCNFVETKNTIDVVVFQTDFEFHTDNYSSKIEEVIHIIDVEKNILAEGAREVMQNGLVVSTITVYPSQFLSLLKKAPARQLQELWRKHGW